MVKRISLNLYILLQAIAAAMLRSLLWGRRLLTARQIEHNGSVLWSRTKKSKVVDTPPWEIEGGLVDLKTGQLYQHEHIAPAKSRSVPSLIEIQKVVEADNEEISEEDLLEGKSVLQRHVVVTKLQDEATAVSIEDQVETTSIFLLQPHFVEGKLQGRRSPELQMDEGKGLIEAIPGKNKALMALIGLIPQDGTCMILLLSS